MASKTTVSVRIPSDLKDKIDSLRGDLTTSQYLGTVIRGNDLMIPKDRLVALEAKIANLDKKLDNVISWIEYIIVGFESRGKGLPIEKFEFEDMSKLLNKIAENNEQK